MKRGLYLLSTIILILNVAEMEMAHDE